MAQMVFGIEEIGAIARGIFENAGVPAADARTVVDNLVYADICGIPSHGLMRVKPYIKRIRAKLTKTMPNISHRQVADTMFAVDGDRALGQVATTYALALCMEAAEKHGNAIATICHMNHFGMASYYTKKAAARGYFAFICTNASASMAPYGGMDALLGTNPFCVSFDAGSYGDFSLDIATTSVARGKIRMYAEEGKPLPPGWATDENGNETTDAEAAMRGQMLPMGGHKGYGLAMAVDALSGILPGADLSCEAESMFNATVPANTGCYMSVVDIKRFLPLGAFEKRTEDWLTRIKSSQKRPGFSEILIPGELENRRVASANGKITLLDRTYEELLALSRTKTEPT